MMRRSPMKRTAWNRHSGPGVKAREVLEEKEPLAPMECAQTAIKTIVKSTAKMARIGDFSPTTISKADTGRNPALLAMARGRPCLLRVPGVCQGGTETTVAAHSNWACHGKGMARKASDAYTVWACASCHIGWLDQGRAAKAVKQTAFMRAHADQVLEWLRIAQDLSEKPRDRKAAQWALDVLNSLPASVNIA